MNNIIVVDIETTGTDPTIDEIIEIGIVKVLDGKIEEWSSLVKPKAKIPVFITKLTGITNEMVENSPVIEDILPTIKKIIGNGTIIAHNRNFDLAFLKKELGLISNLSLDTVELAKIIEPGLFSYSLTNLIKLYSIKNESSHRALADAKATYSLIIKLWNKLTEYDMQLLLQLKKWLSDEKQGLYHELNTLIHDINKTGKWSKIKDSGPTELENLLQEPQVYQGEDFSCLFETTGLLEKKFPNYELRKQQITMFNAINTAFDQGRNLLIEAGTGVGKTLAYLSAALKIATENNKVLISTHTIALQEQICTKDIPLLENVLNTKIGFVLLKGRNNYLCWRQWVGINQEDYNWSWEQRIFWAKITVWLRKTISGDKEDLNLKGYELEFWSRIASNSDSCLGGKCSSFNNCWYNKLRNKANKAQLLIVNHSLLLSDAKIETGILPAYEYLIIDEAHQLEEVATDQFTLVVSKKTFHKLMENIKFRLNSQVLLQWQKKSRFLDKTQELFEYRKKILSNIDLALEVAQSLFEPWEVSNETVRIRIQDRKIIRWMNWVNSAENFIIRLNDLNKEINKLIELWEFGDEPETWQSEIKDWKALSKLILNHIENMKVFLRDDEESYVFWIDRDLKYKEVAFKSAPIDIGNCLKEKLFDLKDSVILTSATMCVGGDFALFQESLGIDKEKTDYCIINSPFEYKEQALVCITNNIPDPTQIGDKEFINYIIPALKECLINLNGNTLVLFTSHKMLQEVYRDLKPYTEEVGIELLAHGIDGNRNALINCLKNKHNKTMVLGANTFWEGVDLPGDALRHLIIVKLPFWPPTIPIIQARVEYLEAKGVNGFYNYSLPKAIIRFKQGFGRLIRTTKDKGVVIIFDHRIISKRYGKLFILALPTVSKFVGDSKQINEKINKWL